MQHRADAPRDARLVVQRSGDEVGQQPGRFLNLSLHRTVDGLRRGVDDLLLDHRMRRTLIKVGAARETPLTESRVWDITA